MCLTFVFRCTLETLHNKRLLGSTVVYWYLYHIILLVSAVVVDNTIGNREIPTNTPIVASLLLALRFQKLSVSP